MNLKRRIERIEALRPPQQCPSCGSIDPATGENLFFCGIMLSQDDGTHDCFCKYCAGSFNACVRNDEQGRCLFSEAQPCEIGV